MEKYCLSCYLDFSWDDEHEWTLLGKSYGDKEYFLCEFCSDNYLDFIVLHEDVAPAGCCLHVVVDDKNLDDSSVDFCIEWAKKAGHGFCEKVGNIIRNMSREERIEVLNEYADDR
jgi:hypothetical protein